MVIGSQFNTIWERYRFIFFFVVLVVVGLIVWSPVFHFQFLSDDWDLIYRADRYESFADRFVQNDHQGMVGYSYRPVVGVYLTVLKSLFGLNPTGYHVFFVLLHILNAVLVMMLARTLVGRWEGKQVGRCLSWIPFIAGFLFLILPSHVEAVAWIAAGVDVVATLFYLLSIYCFLLGIEDPHLPLLLIKGETKRGWVFYILSLIAFSIGLLTKEIVITLPIVILFFSIFPLKVRGVALSDGCPGDTQEEGIMNQNNRNSPNLSYVKRGIIFIAPFIIISGIYFWMRYQTTGTLVGYYGRPTVGVDILQWIRMAADLLSSFVSWGQMRLRISNIFYHNFHWLIVVFAFVVLYIKKFYRRGFAQTFFLLSLFLISLLPVLPLGFNPLSDEGERYGYLPSVFFVMLTTLIVAIFTLRLAPDHQVQSSKFKVQSAGIFVFVFLCFCVIAVYFGCGLHQKIFHWSQYQDSNYQILNQLYQVNNGTKLVIIGLPDSYSGVQGFRNGVEEAYRLYYGEDITIVRIPVYTIDGGEVGYAFQTIHYPLGTTHFSGADGFDASIPNQVFLKTKDKSLRLTGEKEYSDAYIDVRFFRWHYDIGRSDGVTIMLRDDFVQAVDGGTIRMLLYDGSYLFDALL